MWYASRSSVTPVWIVCLPLQHEVSFVMQSLVRLGHHDEMMAWPRYGSVGVKCLSQEHNDKLLSSGTEPRADNVAIVNVRYYSLSCTAAAYG